MDSPFACPAAKMAISVGASALKKLGRDDGATACFGSLSVSVFCLEGLLGADGGIFAGFSAVFEVSAAGCSSGSEAVIPPKHPRKV